MMGMEKMLASMIGLTPEQMQGMVHGIQLAATKGVEALEKIVSQNEEILALLKGENNADGNDHG